MLTHIHPKLPMRNKTSTRDFYINKLDFQEFGSIDFDGYLMLQKDSIQIHFFNLKNSTQKKTMDKFTLERMILTNFINRY